VQIVADHSASHWQMIVEHPSLSVKLTRGKTATPVAALSVFDAPIPVWAQMLRGVQQGVVFQ
jgi:hypothetical protein